MKESSDLEQPLCPHCLTEISRVAHFCPSCGAPLTSHAATDPLGQVYAEGYAFRQALSNRPGVMVLLGVWLIFGPQLLIAVGFLANAVRSPQTWMTLLNEASLLGLLGLYAAILGKVTLHRFVATRAG